MEIFREDVKVNFVKKSRKKVFRMKFFSTAEVVSFFIMFYFYSILIGLVHKLIFQLIFSFSSGQPPNRIKRNFFLLAQKLNFSISSTSIHAHIHNKIFCLIKPQYESKKKKYLTHCIPSERIIFRVFFLFLNLFSVKQSSFLTVSLVDR